MRVSRSYTRLLLSVAAFAAAAAVVLPLCIPAVQIDQATCDRVRPGMTVGEVGALVGGPPGWCEGVSSISADEPPYKGSRPSWYGRGGVIVLTLDREERVAEANFYPAHSADWSPTRWAAERWTRNALGTGRADLAEAAIQGAGCGLFFAGLFALSAVGWWAGGSTAGAFGLCVAGAVSSLALLVLAAGLLSEGREAYWWAGVGASGLAAFIVGSIRCGRRRHAEPAAAPPPAVE